MLVFLKKLSLIFTLINKIRLLLSTLVSYECFIVNVSCVPFSLEIVYIYMFFSARQSGLSGTIVMPLGTTSFYTQISCVFFKRYNGLYGYFKLKDDLTSIG